MKHLGKQWHKRHWWTGLRKPDDMAITSAYAPCVGDQTEWTSTHLQHLAAFAPLHFPDRKEMLNSCFKMLFWAEVYNASVQRGLHAILNVFEGILTTPVFKYFQVLLPFSDWTLKDCTWSKKLSFPCVLLPFNTDPPYMQQRKFNSFIKTKGWGVFLKYLRWNSRRL